jgi:hypothetical protein
MAMSPYEPYANGYDGKISRVTAKIISANEMKNGEFSINGQLPSSLKYIKDFSFVGQLQ